MNQDELRDLMREFYDSPLSFLEFEDADTRVKMKKPLAGEAVVAPVAVPVATPMPAAQPAASPAAPASDNKVNVTAPLVGVYFAASAPGEKPYVALGDHVEEGDVLCLLEAMKMINEIKAPCSGQIRFIAPRNGETVGFGDLLMEIESDGSRGA